MFELRVELYLGCDNDNYDLTTMTAHLMDDFRQVLSPPHFTSGNISGGAKIANAGILQVGFDPRVRGSADEILVYIIEVELHHEVEK